MIPRRALLAGASSGLLAACSSTSGAPVADPPPNGEWNGTHLEGGGNPRPDVTLTDQDGNRYNLAKDPATKAVVLFFGYTNCPDVCPGILADMATAKRRLPADLIDDVTLILVTTDPARDTAPALKEYLARVDEGFIGLTGDLAAIKPAAMSLGIDIADAKQLPSGGYEVDHGSFILGFNEDRVMSVVWNQASAGQLRDDYERLLSGA